MNERRLPSSWTATRQPANSDGTGFDIAGATLPAANVGGDFFDCIRTSPHSLLVAVGDISGYGLDASLHAIRTQAYLRALALHQSNPGEILTDVNRLWATHRLNHRFATVFCAHIDFTTHTLIHAGAGHAGYKISESGELTQFGSTACPLGIGKNTEIPNERRVRLKRGDIIFILSDGFQDCLAADGSVFGIHRVITIVAARKDEPAEQIIQALHDAVTSFRQSHPQQDDMTAVVVKVNC